MNRLTIIFIDKDSDKTFTGTIPITTKEEVVKAQNELSNNVPFSRWYYETECSEELTKEELFLLAELDLLPMEYEGFAG